jgi:hypothetical protein
MARGQILTIPNQTSQLITTLSREQKASLSLLNPNDGICYVKLNSNAGPTVAAWDWKIPSQSYCQLPGPWESLGVYYLDQSGSGRTAEVNVYELDSQISVPSFIAIGRAVQQAGTTMDISQGAQPSNPPASTVRLWADGSGNLHILSPSGVDKTLVDSSTALGGDLYGTIPAAHINVQGSNQLQLNTNFGFQVNGPNLIYSANNGSHLFWNGFGGGWAGIQCGTILANGSIAANGGITVPANQTISMRDGTSPIYWYDQNHRIFCNNTVTGSENTMNFYEYGQFIWRCTSVNQTLMTLQTNGVLTVTAPSGGGLNSVGYVIAGTYLQAPVVYVPDNQAYITSDGSKNLIVRCTTFQVQNTGGTQAQAQVGGVTIDVNGNNNGSWNSSQAIQLGPGSGEGITSQRVGGGNNQFGIDFWTSSNKRGYFTNGGDFVLTNGSYCFGNGTSVKIQWNGTYFNFTNSIQFNTTGNQVNWPNGSYISGNAGYVQGSKESLKENIIALNDNDCLRQVTDPRMVVRSYTWPEDPRNSLGFMAEEVAEVLPLYVIRDEKNNPSGYVPQELVALLWGAVRNLNDRLVKLEQSAIAA